MKQIFVPVDGSELSRRALPYAELLAQAQACTVQLVRVFDPVQWPMTADEGYMDPETYDQMARAIREDARDNLDRDRRTLEAADVQTTTELVADMSIGFALLEVEKRTGPDLVIMATHGRSGVARFALGSIADRLVREGSVPVLLIPAFGESGVRLDRVLVPLDGSGLAEQALQMVRELAGKPLSAVKLVTALASAKRGRADTGFTEEGQANEYLRHIASDLTAAGLATEIAISGEAPADAIEQAAAEVDFVIMSTHGRGGLDRWRHGSVAERATRTLSIPRLLIRAR